MNSYRHEMNIVISQLKDKEKRMLDEITTLSQDLNKLKDEKVKQNMSM